MSVSCSHSTNNNNAKEACDTIDASLCGRYVIFLDVDGVLLPVPRFTFGGGELSGECVTRLAEIVAQLGGPENVTIVLSSTWRNHPDMIEKLNRFFEKEAGGAVPPVKNGTPNGTVLISKVTYYADDPSEQRLVRDRVDEVVRWMRTHVCTHPEAIAGRWFAIDDMDLGVDARMHGHFLKTETDTGLTDERVAAVAPILAQHPTPEEAYLKAQAALVDPMLKNEEIEILTVQRDRESARAAELEEALHTAQSEITSLQNIRRDTERTLKDNKLKIDDMSYRLALQECAKRYRAIELALQMAATRSGAERKEIDERIKSFVNLVRTKKELEKKAKAENRRQRNSISKTF